MAGKQYTYFIYFLYLLKNDKTEYSGNAVIPSPFEIKGFSSLRAVEADVLRDLRKKEPNACNVIIANFKYLGSVADDNT